MTATQRVAEGRGREAPNGGLPSRSGRVVANGGRSGPQPRIPAPVTAEGLFAQPADETDYSLDPAEIVVHVQALIRGVRGGVGLCYPADQQGGSEPLLEVDRHRDRSAHTF